MESVTSKSLRPHMQRRDGETIEQWHYWLANSCYRYGGESADLTVLNVHENLSTPSSATTSRGRFIHYIPQDAPDAPDHVTEAVTGDVVFRYRHAEFQPVSWQCGLPPALMVNRHKELSALDRVVAERSPTVIVLKGHPGLGWTGLALAWIVRHSERFPAGPRYADITADTPASAEPLPMTYRKSSDEAISVTANFISNIAFAGLTAAGKTTHAKRLAAELGYDYVSATEILLEILDINEPSDQVWFTRLEEIQAARGDGAVDTELEERLVSMSRTRRRTVFDT